MVPPNKPSKSVKKKKAGPVETTTTTAEMDLQIWKEFPEELMEPVIARLPITAFLRFRSVSHKWNSLLGSPNLMQLSEQFKVEHQNPPWFFATYSVSGKIYSRCSIDEKMSGALYDPCMKKWHYDIPLPSFRPKFPACAAGGLVCYPDYRSSSFHVGNPLTQTWKKFSLSATARSIFQGNGYDGIGMVSTLNQDNSARGYQIVWLGTEGQYEVYDSLKESTSLGRVPANINLPRGFYRCNPVSIGSVVYFLCVKPNGIISYDAVSGAWQQLLIPGLPERNRLALAECGERMFLVVYVKNNNPATISVCVWELQMKVLVWMEVDKMPSSWSEEFIEEEAYFRCFGNKRLLVISLHTARKNRIFTYDVVSREWSEVPLFVPPRTRRHRQSIMTGIGFFPSLLASP